MTEFLPWNATWWGIGCTIPYQNGQKLGISNEPQRCYAEASWLETLFLCVLTVHTVVVDNCSWSLRMKGGGHFTVATWCDQKRAAVHMRRVRCSICFVLQILESLNERCNIVLRSVGVSCVCVYAHCASSQNCAMTSVFAVGKSFSWANAGDLVLIHCTYYFPSERKLWIIVCLLIWKVYDVVQDALRVLYVPWFIDVSTGDRTVCG